MPLRLSDLARYLKTPQAAQALAPFARRMAEQLPSVDSTSQRIGAELAGRAPHLATGSGLDRAVLGALAEDADLGAPLEPGILATRLLDAFSTASRGGTLERALVERRLGAEAAQLLDRAAQALASAGPADGSPRFADLAPTTRARLGEGSQTGALRARMPALQASLDAATEGGLRPFEGVDLRAVQHLFPTTWALIGAMEDAGLDPTRLGLVGKKYSTDEATFDAASAEASRQLIHAVASGGIEVGLDGLHAKPGVSTLSLDARSSSVEDWDPQGPDESQAAYLERVVHERLARMLSGKDPTKGPKHRQLVLDEGGIFLKVLHHDFPDFAKWFVAVEQTEKGHRVLEDLARRGELKCAVVSIARTDIKKRLESPMIGEIIAADIVAQVEASGATLPNRTVTLVGLGAVGLETGRALQRRGFQVRAVDIDPAKAVVAAREGFTFGTKEALLPGAGLVVGCTGAVPPPLSPADWALLPPGAVLANAASGNAELGNTSLTDAERPAPNQATDWASFDTQVHQTFLGQDIVVGEQSDPSNQHLVARLADGKELLVLRGGAVVNMTSDLPPEYIQLTRAALFEACAQALEETEPGIHELSAERQARVLEATERCLKALGKSLETPDFSGLAPARL